MGNRVMKSSREISIPPSNPFKQSPPSTPKKYNFLSTEEKFLFKPNKKKKNRECLKNPTEIISFDFDNDFFFPFLLFSHQIDEIEKRKENDEEK